MTITGLVKQIFYQETKGNFTFRNCWITIPGEYPQTIELQASGQKLNLFDNLKVGQEITAHVNLKGKEWNGKVFHSFGVWKIEAGVTTQPAQEVATSKDDLPF